MTPRKAGSWVSRKVTDKVSVTEFHPPAPPPCEAPLPNVAEAEELAFRLEAIPGCLEGMPGGYGTWAPASAAEYIRRQALVILAKSEEIAELRALVESANLGWWEMNPDKAKAWEARRAAALAPKGE